MTGNLILIMYDRLVTDLIENLFTFYINPLTKLMLVS